MSKSIKTLIKLSKFNVDEKRRLLLALQEREEQIIAEIKRSEEQLAEEQRIAAEDSTGAGFAYGAYAKSWLGRREQLLRMLEAVRVEIVAARDAVAEAFSELKTYETVLKERERRAREEADRKEQTFLDEVGLNMFRQREAE
ncbi:MAG: flagellar FliJ family protein [Magnetospirillum sp.]|nr:flagellar FliJ family protein [Magnetospirillum sp.]